MADIQKMFFKSRFPKEDQSFLRFLWWPNEDLTQDPREYCVTLHLFGAGSTPGCSNFAVKRTAEERERSFGTLTSMTP